MAYQIMSL